MKREKTGLVQIPLHFLLLSPQSQSVSVLTIVEMKTQLCHVCSIRQWIFIPFTVKSCPSRCCDEPFSLPCANRFHTRKTISVWRCQHSLAVKKMNDLIFTRRNWTNWYRAPQFVCNGFECYFFSSLLCHFVYELITFLPSHIERWTFRNRNSLSTR